MTIPVSAEGRRLVTPVIQRHKLLLVCGVGLLLRLLLLGSKGLWLDEVRSIQVTGAGFDAWLSGRVEAYHPPLYYILLMPWLRIAHSEFLLRLPSAVLGALTIPLTYALTRRLWEERTALISAWLVALSPLLVWYSQELRSYSLLVLLSVVSLLLLTWLLESPSYWLGGLNALVIAAGLYLHYDAFLVLPLQLLLFVGLAASSRVNAKAAWLLVWVWTVALAGYLPWMRAPAMKRFAHMLVGNRLYFRSLLAGVVDLPDELIFPLAVAGSLTILILLLVAVWTLIRRHTKLLRDLRSRPAAQVLSVLVYLSLLVVSVVPRGYMIKRHVLIGWVPLLIGFAWLWSKSFPSRLWWWGLCVVSLVGSLVNVVAVPKPQWREVTRLVVAQARPEDVTLLSPGYMGVPFGYYSKGEIDTAHIGTGDPTQQLSHLAEKYDRLWYAYHTADVGPYRAATKAWLEQSAELLSEKEFYKVSVELYDLP